MVGELKLLVPLETELSRSQMETVLKWRDWMRTAGFELDQRGPAVALLRRRLSSALFYGCGLYVCLTPGYRHV